MFVRTGMGVNQRDCVMKERTVHRKNSGFPENRVV